jgi:hypothetical protein
VRELPRRFSKPLLWTGLSQLSKNYVTPVGFEPTLCRVWACCLYLIGLQRRGG